MEDLKKLDKLSKQLELIEENQKKILELLTKFQRETSLLLQAIRNEL